MSDLKRCDVPSPNGTGRLCLRPAGHRGPCVRDPSNERETIWTALATLAAQRDRLAEALRVLLTCRETGSFGPDGKQGWRNADAALASLAPATDPEQPGGGT